MAPFLRLLAGSSLLAGLVAAVTTRLARRKRSAKPNDLQSSPEVDKSAHNVTQQVVGSNSDSGVNSQVEGLSTSEASSSAITWRPAGGQQVLHNVHQQPSSCCPLAYHGVEQYRRSSESQGVGVSSSSGSGLHSRVLGAAGRISESLESAVSCSGDTAGSSTHGGAQNGDDYDSSEEQDTSEGGAESSRSGYGKSDRARLVDLWVESALLVSRDVRLDKRHFNRTTRQNLKKMRPASAQLILSEIADRCWDSTPDISREVHRLVSHAKAQDKFAMVPGSGTSGGLGASLGSSNLGSGAGAGTTGLAGASTGFAGRWLGDGGMASGAGCPAARNGNSVVTTTVTALLATGGGGKAAVGTVPLGLGSAMVAAPAGGPSALSGMRCCEGL